MELIHNYLNFFNIFLLLYIEKIPGVESLRWACIWKI